MSKIIFVSGGRQPERNKQIAEMCKSHGIEVVFDSEIRVPHKENPMLALTQSAELASREFGNLSMSIKPKKHIPFYESLKKYKRKY